MSDKNNALLWNAPVHAQKGICPAKAELDVVFVQIKLMPGCFGHRHLVLLHKKEHVKTKDNNLQ